MNIVKKYIFSLSFCSISSQNTTKDASQTTADQKRKNQETKESTEGKFWGTVIMCCSRKYPYPPCRRSLEILFWGVRRLKCQLFLKESMKVKWKFLRGGMVVAVIKPRKLPLMGYKYFLEQDNYCHLRNANSVKIYLE